MKETEQGIELVFAVIASYIAEKFMPEKPAPTRKQKLMGIIEEMTLNSRFGRSYHKGIHEAFEKDHTKSEINQAIHTLRKKRILNQHQGPEDTAYTHNNKFKTFIAGLDYIF